jgi:hypothetical protein
MGISLNRHKNQERKCNYILHEGILFLPMNASLSIGFKSKGSKFNMCYVIQ